MAKLPASPKKGEGKVIDSGMKEIWNIAKECNLKSTLGLTEFENQQKNFDKVIEDLDTNLNRVLRKQEYEYLQAYNIYVKRKEKELVKLITALDEKNSNNNFKDMRISQLEVTIDQMRKDAFNYEQKQEQLIKEIKSGKEKLKVEQEEKEFFHKQALDAKRKNKLLKVAIGRL